MTDEVKIKREVMTKVFESMKTVFHLYQTTNEPGEELYREKWLSEWCGMYTTIVALGLRPEFLAWEEEQIRKELSNE